MAGMAETQKKSFQQRMKRIHKGGPNTMGHLLVGSQDSSMGKPVKPIKMRRGDTFFSRLSHAIADLVLMPFSFLLGAAAMVGGMTAVYYLGAMGFLPEPEGLFAYTDVMVAAALAVLVGGVLRLTKGIRKVAIAVGVLAVFLLQDALIATYPEPFAILMPTELPAWADAVSVIGT